MMPKDIKPVDDRHRLLLERSQACLDEAIRLSTQFGISVIPLCNVDHIGVGREHGRKCTKPGKMPLVKWTEFQSRIATEKEIIRWWRDFTLCNLGIVLGSISKLIGIDVDSPWAEDRLQELSGGDLPITWEFSTGKGRRLLYRLPEGIQWGTAPIKGPAKDDELRFQCRGAETVFPPSLHKTGSIYFWVGGRGPGSSEPAPIPKWMSDGMPTKFGTSSRYEDGTESSRIVSSSPDPSKDGGPIQEGGRNDILFRTGCGIRNLGGSEAMIAQALLVMNDQRCVPPLDEFEVRTIARSAARYDPNDADAAWSMGSADDILASVEAARSRLSLPGNVPESSRDDAKPDGPSDATGSRSAQSQEPENGKTTRTPSSNGKPSDADMPAAIQALRGKDELHRLKIRKVLRVGTDPNSMIELVLDDERKINMGKPMELLSLPKARAAVASATGMVLPPVKARAWGIIVELMFKAAEQVEDIGTDATSETRMWVWSYINAVEEHTGRLDLNMDDQARLAETLIHVSGCTKVGAIDASAFRSSAGAIYLKPTKLRLYVSNPTTFMANVSDSDIRKRLRDIGFERVQLSAWVASSKRTIKERMLRSPDGFDMDSVD